MFHFYDGYHFIGMHMLWWFFWIFFLVTIFSAYEPVRRNRGSKNGSVDRNSGDRPDQ